MARIKERLQKFPQTFISPIREFIKDSRAVGIILICCTILSLILSNCNFGPNYTGFWETELHMPAHQLHLPHTIVHVINDALMAIFFFLAGLEIKRALLIGELSSFKKSALPIVAAFGGMLVPALIYMLWCAQTPFAKGWGVPMATDIAFSLGVLSLLGKRAPLSLRILLTALAIIDDLGAILAIAVFYTEEIKLGYLALAAIIMFVLTLMNLLKVTRHYWYLILGLMLWYCVFNSGIHATVAGVLLAFTIPLYKIDELEHNLHDPVNFIILPLFALANTAIILPGDFSSIFSSVVHHGILAGLVIGKPLGIFLLSFIAVKAKLASLPDGLTWRHILGMGMIAGIGFTMSIFIATLAFPDPEVTIIAKVAVIGASLLAGVLGYLYLSRVNRIHYAIKKPVNTTGS